MIEGTLVRISATFTVSGAATDPTTVTLKVRSPAGTVSTYTYGAGQVTKDSVGNYHKDVDASTSGRWLYRWEGTGTAQAADESAFDIEASAF